MSNWIVRANPELFRIHDFIEDHKFVEYLQTDNWEEGDIIYLYITGDAKRVEYKMVVKRANIPLKDAYDDRVYSRKNPPSTFLVSDVFARFDLIKRVENKELSYKKLCEHGYVGKNGRPLPMTSNRILPDETAKYIECFFSE
jgi:5-methylcytosine-specific restriction protein A